MYYEPVGERFAARVSGWVTRPYKLYPFHFNPRLVCCSIKAPVFNHLTQKGYNPLCAFNEAIKVNNIRSILLFIIPYRIYLNQEDLSHHKIVLAICQAGLET